MDKKQAGKNRAFIEDMDNDPNMGMNPRWRAKNKGEVKKEPTKSTGAKKK